ncbi:MAG: iron chelate uptake ABC transporter family permease subunit [Pseudomonadota bacterium]
MGVLTGLTLPMLALALSALTGALMTTLADLIGRTALAPVQIHAGLPTALLGVPVFVLLLIRRPT